MIVRRARVVALIALATAGCRDIMQACTLIGCDSGVTVRLDQSPATPYRIEIGAQGGPAGFTRDCPSAGACGVAFDAGDLGRGVIFVRIINGAGTRTIEVQPQYQESRPNGPQCDPVCYNGIADVDV